MKTNTHIYIALSKLHDLKINTCFNQLQHDYLSPLRMIQFPVVGFSYGRLIIVGLSQDCASHKMDLQGGEKKAKTNFKPAVFSLFSYSHLDPSDG